MNRLCVLLIYASVTGCIVTHAPEPADNPFIKADIYEPAMPFEPVINEPVVATPNCLPVTANSTPLCKAMFKTVYAAAEMVADSLGCIDMAAVAADVGQALAKLDFCDVKKRGLLGLPVCYTLTNYAAEFAVKRLPASWQCSGGYVTVYAKKQMLDACRIAFPY